MMEKIFGTEFYVASRAVPVVLILCRDGAPPLEGAEEAAPADKSSAVRWRRRGSSGWTTGNTRDDGNTLDAMEPGTQPEELTNAAPAEPQTDKDGGFTMVFFPLILAVWVFRVRSSLRAL